MSRFLIYAYQAEFEHRSTGFSSMTYKPFDPKLYAAEFEATKATEVEAEKARVADVLKVQFPGVSFFVNAMLRAGRAPNGFKRLRRLEYDAVAVAAVDDAVAALVAANALDPVIPLPEPVIDGALYRVVGLPGGPVHEFTAEQLFPALEVRGHRHSGFSKSLALRQELRGRPQFEGLCGPMFDGFVGDLPVVRYETPAMNAALSI